MHTHPMYVCERCGWGHYHPLSYCVRCPGKLKRIEKVPHLENPKTIQENREFLAKQGITYFGDYPEVDEKLQLENQLERYKELLFIRQLECIFNYTNNLNRGLHPDRSVTAWKKEIKQLERKIKELENVKTV